MGGEELELVKDAFATNWIAPLGPHVDQFEREFAELIGRRTADDGRQPSGALHAAALSSGTAALHLAMRWLNLQPGDEVICSSLTFSASVNPVLYERATPVFVDCDATSWNMAPALLAEAVEDRIKRGRKPKAVILVHLYGQCADIDPIAATCAQHGIPLIEDAAEALGAIYYRTEPTADGGRRRPDEGGRTADGGGRTAERGQRTDGGGRTAEDGGRAVVARSQPGAGPQFLRGKIEAGTAEDEGRTADRGRTTESGRRTSDVGHLTSGIGRRSSGIAPGSVGLCGIHSFNGNKIITTSGGGMLTSNNAQLIEKARFWATQSRDPAPHYQHSEVGFNYRMSNVLAAIGRGQLRVLGQRVDARRRNCAFYQAAFQDLPGVAFMPEADFNRCTRWLTCITIDPRVAGTDREKVRLALAEENIEARPVWKPMHLQPIFKDCPSYGGAVSERLFADGLCLPSGSNLTESDLQRVTEVFRKQFDR